ncbi:lipocalin-like domain-containing protein [Pseudomonas aeruginosa]|uniref:lipocalin-like domain-containing protein n=1 Tax=Pseudomonas aeruginosa TaxID=287 RepID=UPI000FC427C8|nr:lipocalin-like domain-containing protein [Pseudomonas aeruginosa]RUI15297.1 lipocalin-like domain-containing protein [Pseudomonas aeruginosa]
MNKATIQGRWDILSWEQIYDDGRVVHPMGTELEGFIEYGPHGMFCVVAKAGRAEFTTGGQWSADVAEQADAYASYLTYAGDYDVQENLILHHVRYSLFPNWVGGTQRRVATLEADELILSARLEEETSEARTARLVWRRQGS